jgi:hypothetical protein
LEDLPFEDVVLRKILRMDIVVARCGEISGGGAALVAGKNAEVFGYDVVDVAAQNSGTKYWMSQKARLHITMLWGWADFHIMVKSSFPCT